ncbi:hypothetical protein AAFC00_003047 [Neodothiora populina]|uniref:Endonuclease/exonuclease/phosphatase domain-containing protein n=1 Tax=Neodothiora populina TaxID=2781224 RepID=A0ABR3P942_9PEZI
MNREISPPPTKRRRIEPDRTEIVKHENDILSIYSWNINGISPFVQPSIKSFFQSKTHDKKPDDTAHASLRDFLRRQNWPTVLCLQEVKMNPDDEATKRAVEKAVRRPPSSSSSSSASTTHVDNNDKKEPDYRAFFCLPSDPHNARGFGRKVYGVCTIVRVDFLEATNAVVRTVDWDLEGRFSIIETRQSPSSSPATTAFPTLSIWNIYAVNGTSSPYKDPRTGLVTGTRHTRKLAVHTLLRRECKQLERKGYAVVLAGDMNIARERIDGHPGLRTFPEQHVLNREDFNGKFFGHGRGVGSEVGGKIGDDEGLGAIDTFRFLHRDKKGYTYYPRGGTFGSSCDRVDMVICSASLRENIASAGMLETPADRGPSDHCPLYATFDFGPGKKSRGEANISNDRKE